MIFIAYGDIDVNCDYSTSIQGCMQYEQQKETVQYYWPDELVYPSWMRSALQQDSELKGVYSRVVYTARSHDRYYKFAACQPFMRDGIAPPDNPWEAV